MADLPLPPRSFLELLVLLRFLLHLLHDQLAWSTTAAPVPHFRFPGTYLGGLVFEDQRLQESLEGHLGRMDHGLSYRLVPGMR